MIRSSLKVMGLCLVAAFVMSAVAVATASAAKPEFLFRGTGSARAFSSKQTTEGVLETSKGEEVKCKAATNYGTFKNAKEVENVLISFTGCTATITLKTYTCTSKGANEGEIKTFDLQGKLGYINAAEKKVGILLSPEVNATKNPKTLFAEFTCTKGSEKIEIKTKGSTIGLITPVNTLIEPKGTNEFFTITSEKGEGKGVPLDTKFEGEAANKLLTETTFTIKEKGEGEAAFIESAIAGSAKVYPLESLEICA